MTHTRSLRCHVQSHMLLHQPPHLLNAHRSCIHVFVPGHRCSHSTLLRGGWWSQLNRCGSCRPPNEPPDHQNLEKSGLITILGSDDDGFLASYTSGHELLCPLEVLYNSSICGSIFYLFLSAGHLYCKSLEIDSNLSLNKNQLDVCVDTNKDMKRTRLRGSLRTEDLGLVLGPTKNCFELLSFEPRRVLFFAHIGEKKTQSSFI